MIFVGIGSSRSDILLLPYVFLFLYVILLQVFPSVNPTVLEQLKSVDCIIFAMGSLFTSICPSLVTINHIKCSLFYTFTLDTFLSVLVLFYFSFLMESISSSLVPTPGELPSQVYISITFKTVYMGPFVPSSS